MGSLGGLGKQDNSVQERRRLHGLIVAFSMTIQLLIIEDGRWWILTRGRQRIGLLVLVVVFAMRLVIGSSEHFFVAGPTNVFDVGSSDWALPFKLNVVILVLLEVTGRWSLCASKRCALGFCQD
jgi:hypothetical protein